MRVDIESRSVHLGVGEFAAFSIGPREGGDGFAGLWRAQLGTVWHQQLRGEAARADATARFEIAIEGAIVHRGWRFNLSGRMDQVFQNQDGVRLREIKSVTVPLPADEAELRRTYPEYFVQAGAYLALWRMARVAGTRRAAAELLFVEVSSGITQAIPIGYSDEALFSAQLERITEFLEQRLAARNRLKQLQFRPAFTELRAGQKEALELLAGRVRSARSPILFEAPTGFGKTGVVVQTALERLRAGDFERVIYLTSKSTGQLQVRSTLAAMTATGGVAVWQVRNKGEHCINEVYHCVRDQCRFLAGCEERWPGSGLSRFFVNAEEPRDLENLRAGGLAAAICPYEITRAALAYNDVWIGDYNYVFAPRNRGIFYNQPGFEPARTLLIVDEAHNLPSRAADCFSHRFTAAAAQSTGLDLSRAGAPSALSLAWDRWTRFLEGLRRCDRMTLDAEDDARSLAADVAERVRGASLDYLALGQPAAEELWRVPALLEDLAAGEMPRLWWSSQAGTLDLTCLDASAVIGRTLGEYGGVIMMSATFGLPRDFAAACGIGDMPGGTASAPAPVAAIPDKLGELTKRDTRRLFKQVTSGAALLRVEEEIEASAPVLVSAPAPWRDNAYRVGYDARVDTSFQHRSQYYSLTAHTISRLRAASPRAVAAFFPSYGYAEAVRGALVEAGLELKVEMQPRSADLAAQSAWVESALRDADALLLVLGSSFAESIDLLGGQVSHAMVVGPALPEVNAVQRAKLDVLIEAGASRDEAFRKVYQVPGMTKVNQALGRLVRAPGQRATVLLHCRRFCDRRYRDLLGATYQSGVEIHAEAELDAWLG